MGLTKASFSMINGIPLNILDYGADPTGVAESTQALQNAVTAAVAAGNSVYMPAGTHTLSNTHRHRHTLLS